MNDSPSADNYALRPDHRDDPASEELVVGGGRAKKPTTQHDREKSFGTHRLETRLNGNTQPQYADYRQTGMEVTVHIWFAIPVLLISASTAAAQQAPKTPVDAAIRTQAGAAIRNEVRDAVRKIVRSRIEENVGSVIQESVGRAVVEAAEKPIHDAVAKAVRDAVQRRKVRQ